MPSDNGNKQIDTVSLKRLRTIVSKFEHLDDDCEASFEFIIASCFPNVWKNIQEEMRRNYTAGYIQGLNETLEDFNPSKMNGIVKIISKIESYLNEIYDEVDYMTNDAGFHGWYGEPLKNEENIRDNFIRWVNVGKALCNKALGKEDNNEN